MTTESELWSGQPGEDVGPAAAPALVPVQRRPPGRTRAGRLGRYLLIRLGGVALTLVGVSIAIFLIMHLTSGKSAAQTVAGMGATQSQVETVRHQLGLDRPLYEQYWTFISGAVHGDLGVSAGSGLTVTSQIEARLPFTIELALFGAIVGTSLGVGLGILAAIRRNTPVDYAASSIAVIGVSVPVYWLGLLLILLFAVKLHWLPAAGAKGVTSVILPGICVALFFMAMVARLTRGSLLDVLQKDYIRTARSKGMSGRKVILRHALKNASLPVATVVGLQFGALLGGTVLTEYVFAWPGIGQLLVNAIFSDDLFMVQGIILVFALLIAVVNLLTDLLYLVLDPRITY